AARGARAVRVDAPLERGPGRDRLAPRVDRDDDALAPEPLDGLADERGPLERGRVQGDLVGAGAQQAAHVVDRAEPTADGRGRGDPRGRAGGAGDRGGARLVRAGDVEEHELVGTLGVIGERGLDRIAGVAQVDELHTLDDATVLYVEARDDALGEHGYLAPALAAAEASRRS